LSVKKEDEVEAKRAGAVLAVPPSRPNLAFSAKELVLVNFPHTDPDGSKRAAHVPCKTWVRENGAYSLILQSGAYVDKRESDPEKRTKYLGIPYGATARLLLFFIMTEAIRTDTRKVKLGKSFNDFLTKLGGGKDRGKKSLSASVIEQFNRLTSAKISLQVNQQTETHDIETTIFIQIAEAKEFWHSRKKKDQSSFFESYVLLTEDFFRKLKGKNIPLDWDVLLKIKKSPFAIDLYCWLTYEAAKAQTSGKSRFIPWHSLKEQMGADYTEVEDFSKAARRELKKIVAAYPALVVETPRGGLVVRADSLPSITSDGSAPHLPAKTKKSRKSEV